jgi:hypothetical protein
MNVARAIAATLLCWALVSCGGGSGGSTLLAGGEGVGTGGTGITLGTVTGFGSVVIDGVSYNSASPQYFAQSSLSEAAPAAPADVGLGAQVQLELDAQGNPSSVLVAPELVGAVAEADANGFSVNGVRVQFNKLLAAGPRTYFTGLQGPGAVRNGMQVAVSGAYGLDALGAPKVQATLVERLPDANTILRITGTVSGLDSNRFQLGAMTVRYGASTQVLPAQTTLANGQLVKVWSNQSLGNAGSVLTANTIRVHSLLGRSGSAHISGLVSLLSGSRFQINGIGVDASASALAASLATLVNGQYVSVQGQIDAGSLRASAITSYASQPVQTEIQGTITGYTGVGTFFVRGVPVDASTAQFLNGATAAALADGVYVDLVGMVGATQSDVIVASTVAVIGLNAPSGKSVEYRGLVRQFVSASQPFVLLRSDSGGSVKETVTLAGNVSYSNGSASQLANNAGIEIEATKNASGLTAYSVNFIGSGPGPGGGAVQPVLVRGRVDSLSANTLQVAGLLIQRNGVVAQGGVLASGASVEVWISAAGGTYLAQSIRIRD